MTVAGPVSAPPSGRLLGRTCVIAGAGGSIAGAVAGRLMAEGASVVGIDRQAIEASFPVIQADLAIEPEVRAAFERIGGERGPIHALYVNAGSVEREDTSLLSAPAEVWPRSFANIVLPTVFACRCAVPHMTGEQGGSIILTGSFLAGIGAATAQMAFSASKAAVVQIGRDLGIHLARSGIRVNTLSLGPIETPELRRMFDHIGPEQVARRMSRVPLGRPATLDEVAAAVAYLASDDSGYLTGSVFPVDGGIPAAYTIPGQ